MKRFIKRCRSSVLGFWLGTALLFSAATSGWARPPLPPGPVQVYFLAIGSQDYAFNAAASKQGFPPIYAPENSARLVADTLIAAGAAGGILLTSNAAAPGSAMVTRNDMLHALFDLKALIRQQQAKNPRIIVYFIGHGLGDAANRFLYLIPGNLVFKDRATQTLTIRVLKRSVWNFDIISAVVNFRLHPVMRYMDDFVPTQFMPDITSLTDVAAVAKRTQEMTSKDDDNRAQGLYPPDGNAPVPFLILFDNCYGGVVSDLVSVPTSGSGEKFLDDLYQQMAALEADGMVFYAAAPGKNVDDVTDPSKLDLPLMQRPRVGQLAARLYAALHGRPMSQPLSFSAFKTLFQRELPSQSREDHPLVAPYGDSNAQTTGEILGAELFSEASAGTPATYEQRRGTGTGVVFCCANP